VNSFRVTTVSFTPPKSNFTIPFTSNYPYLTKMGNLRITLSDNDSAVAHRLFSWKKHQEL
jgi:hypothetical protein